MTTSSSRSSSYHHGDLRQALLSEAVRILREEGEGALSMRKLALNIGVSRTASYHYFADKQALLCAVAEEGFRRFVAATRAEPAAGALAREDIARFVRDYVRFAAENPEYYDLMFGSQLWKSGGLTEPLTREAHRAFRSYVDTVRGWQERGQISADLDPLRYAQVSWSTLHGICRFLIDGIYVDRAALDAMCEAATDMFWLQLSAG